MFFPSVCLGQKYLTYSIINYADISGDEDCVEASPSGYTSARGNLTDGENDFSV